MGTLKRFLASAVIAATLGSLSCGGGGGGSGSDSGVAAPAPNVLSVAVNSGPNGNAVDTLYTTVTICVPGSTTECQTIDNIQIDTGSYGLRVLASVLTLSLPVSKASDGNSLVECTQFVDGFSWGPVATADVQLAGEAANSLPVQVIGSTNFANVPAGCSSTGTAEDTVATFGANGILGVGVFEQDCGVGCVESAAGGYYYSCSATACNPTEVALSSEVANPIPFFVTDNNGSIIELPGVADDGSASVSGSLIFGIDTRSNNASGGQTVLTLDDSGYFTTVFNGEPLPNSFIDSGSNGYYFNDSEVATCSESEFAGFYCPASVTGLSATLTGQNGRSATVSFTVQNAQTMYSANPTFAAFSTVAGTFSSSQNTFDWGLPFFFGRSVYNGIENHTSSAGTGPYVAF